MPPMNVLDLRLNLLLLGHRHLGVPFITIIFSNHCVTGLLGDLLYHNPNSLACSFWPRVRKPIANHTFLGSWRCAKSSISGSFHALQRCESSQ